MRTLFILTIGLTACATKHPGTYEVMESTGGDASALTSEADALWEQRDDKAKLSEALTKYAAAHEVDPKDRHVATRLTRGYYFLGDAYEDAKEDKLAAWEESITWGKRCMAINEAFAGLLAKGDETEATAVRVVTKDDVPCLYWTATSLGKWAKLSGLAKTLKHIGTVKAYMTRVGELDPTYFYNAPDRYWGAYYAAIPSFAGRDLDKSRTHFDKSINGSPEYVGTKVLLAEFWAVQKQDRETFTKTLEEVVETDISSVPEDIRPEVKAEIEKARALLDETSNLFAD